LQDAGLLLGATGGILVNELCRHQIQTFYAAGDCVESLISLQGKKVHAPYGDLANSRGVCAGENCRSRKRATFPETIQTGICKVFDFAAGSTGLYGKAARAAGYIDY
jgi:NADPH-dependent 2,4-dienoyl-CoA reductase/sulfur reductase-like enzyme